MERIYSRKKKTVIKKYVSSATTIQEFPSGINKLLLILILVTLFIRKGQDKPEQQHKVMTGWMNYSRFLRCLTMKNVKMYFHAKQDDFVVWL